MKISKLLLILSLFAFAFATAQEKGAYVQINGKTNVNQFKCTNNNIHQKFKLSLQKETPKNLEKNTINLYVKDFDCRNRIMTSDFQKTLRAEKYPFFIIAFLSLEKNNAKYKALIQVKMMNTTKYYNVELIKDGSYLYGEKTVKFSDFGMVPPKKAGGIVNVKDDLDLSFRLKLE